MKREKKTTRSRSYSIFIFQHLDSDQRSSERRLTAAQKIELISFRPAVGLLDTVGLPGRVHWLPVSAGGSDASVRDYF